MESACKHFSKLRQIAINKVKNLVVKFHSRKKKTLNYNCLSNYKKFSMGGCLKIILKYFKFPPSLTQ